MVGTILRYKFKHIADLILQNILKDIIDID